MNDKCIIIITHIPNSKISPAKQTGLFLIKDEIVDEKLTLHLRDEESKVKRRYFQEHGARRMGWVMSIFPVSVSELMCCSIRLGCFQSGPGTIKAHPLICSAWFCQAQSHHSANLVSCYFPMDSENADL